MPSVLTVENCSEWKNSPTDQISSDLKRQARGTILSYLIILQSKIKKSLYLSLGTELPGTGPIGRCCRAGLCLAEFVPDGGPRCSNEDRKGRLEEIQHIYLEYFEEPGFHQCGWSTIISVIAFTVDMDNLSAGVGPLYIWLDGSLDGRGGTTTI